MGHNERKMLRVARHIGVTLGVTVRTTYLAAHALPPEFTLSALQRAVEAIAGVPLHKQNFRRVVERIDLVEGLGRMDTETGGRPAELFRFRRELLTQRPAGGLSLPLLRD